MAPSSSGRLQMKEPTVAVTPFRSPVTCTLPMHSAYEPGVTLRSDRTNDDQDAETHHHAAAHRAKHDEALGRTREPLARGARDESPGTVTEKCHHAENRAKEEQLHGDVALGAIDEVGKDRREEDQRLRVEHADRETLAHNMQVRWSIGFALGHRSRVRVTMAQRADPEPQE